MRKKDEVINEFKILISSLKKHNKHYYEDDSPTISDSEFDKLKKKIVNLEKEHTFLKKIKSVENIIGSRPSSKFKKIKH